MKKSMILRSTLAALLLSAPGCMKHIHSRTLYQDPPGIKVDGAKVEPTKARVIASLGEPTFVVPIDGGEILVWRRDRSRPRRTWHEDSIYAFDPSGHFMPLHKTPDELCKLAPCPFVPP